MVIIWYFLVKYKRISGCKRVPINKKADWSFRWAIETKQHTWTVRDSTHIENEIALHFYCSISTIIRELLFCKKKLSPLNLLELLDLVH